MVVTLPMIISVVKKFSKFLANFKSFFNKFIEVLPAIYKTRNAGTVNGMRRMRETWGIFTRIPRNLVQDSGECYCLKIPGNVSKDSGEC